MVIRLRTFFKTSAAFSMNLQTTYDVRNAAQALPASVRKKEYRGKHKRPGVSRGVKRKMRPFAV